MTPEEASVFLSDMELHIEEPKTVLNHVRKEALQMAIKALKAQPNLQPICNDLVTDTISRQAAIDAIKTSRYLVDAMEKIIKLSPVQPERMKGKWIKKMRVTETEKYMSYDPDWYCACCGAKYDPHVAKIVNFCYVCGADMRGEQNE